MPYHIGEKGSYGCSGYPAVKDDGTVMGCHKTKEAAANQIYAINQSEGNIDEKDTITTESGMGIKNPEEWPKATKADAPEGYHYMPDGTLMADWMPHEGDMVMGMTSEGAVIGRVEHVMLEGGTYGVPGTEYAIESTPEDPAMAVRIYEEDDGIYYATAYSIGMLASKAKIINEEVQVGTEEGNDEYEKFSKAETYSPNAGMKAAARRALKWKEDGKAKGAGTPVGWGRATDIVAGRSMSLSVVKRMYSFFSRHEVDKKGKGFYSGPDFPSKGRVMWDAWGGDAGFSWSRKIVERNKDKALFGNIFKGPIQNLPSKGYADWFMKAEEPKVGDMVSWGSSGGRARGKIVRILRSGSYSPPGTDVTITASEDSPAAVIRLYNGDEPTNQMVGHKLKTLRRI